MLLLPAVFYISTTRYFILTEHGLASHNKVISKKSLSIGVTWCKGGRAWGEGKCPYNIFVSKNSFLTIILKKGQ